MTQAQMNQTWKVNLGFGLSYKPLETRTIRQAKQEAKKAGAYGISIYNRGTKALVCEIRFA